MGFIITFFVFAMSSKKFTKELLNYVKAAAIAFCFAYVAQGIYYLAKTFL